MNMGLESNLQSNMTFFGPVTFYLTVNLNWNFTVMLYRVLQKRSNHKKTSTSDYTGSSRY